MSCVLRLQGDVDLYAQTRAAGLGPDVMGQAADGSLATVPVSEADFSDLQTQIEDAIAFLKRSGSAIKTILAKPAGRKVALDFGIAAKDVPAYSCRLPAELLKLAGDLGIEITVSIYQITDAHSK